MNIDAETSADNINNTTDDRLLWDEEFCHDSAAKDRKEGSEIEGTNGTL